MLGERQSHNGGDGESAVVHPSLLRGEAAYLRLPEVDCSSLANGTIRASTSNLPLGGPFFDCGHGDLFRLRSKKSRGGARTARAPCRRLKILVSIMQDDRLKTGEHRGQSGQTARSTSALKHHIRPFATPRGSATFGAASRSPRLRASAATAAVKLQHAYKDQGLWMPHGDQWGRWRRRCVEDYIRETLVHPMASPTQVALHLSFT